MNYKLLRTDEETGKNLYARIDDDGIVRVTCNEDDLQYQEWLAKENNTPPVR